MNLSLAVLFLMGIIAIVYGIVMKEEFEDGSFIFKILLIAGGFLAVAGSLFMKFVFSVI